MLATTQTSIGFYTVFGALMPYFAFIDGMRALAVLGVIAFHFKLGAGGGYIGVDLLRAVGLPSYQHSGSL